MTQFAWVGADGTFWDLNEGPVYVNPGVQGLSMPVSDQYTGSSPALHGQRFTGWRARSRDVFLPVTIQPEDNGWLDVARSFWAGLRPDQPGTLEVTSSDGEMRSLACRFVDDSTLSYDIDPALFEREVAGLNLVADDPWWKGPVVERLYGPPPVGDPFFSTSGSVLTLTTGGTVATATVTNPGDVAAWPVWHILGPFTSFSVGVNGAAVAATMTLADGQYLEIDTDPRNQVARIFPDNTAVPLSAFSSVRFVEIPAGESVALDLTVSGTGSVSVWFSPRYFRAF